MLQGEQPLAVPRLSKTSSSCWRQSMAKRTSSPVPWNHGTLKHTQNCEQRWLLETGAPAVNSMGRPCWSVARWYTTSTIGEGLDSTQNWLIKENVAGLLGGVQEMVRSNNHSMYWVHQTYQDSKKDSATARYSIFGPIFASLLLIGFSLEPGRCTSRNGALDRPRSNALTGGFGKNHDLKSWAFFNLFFVYSVYSTHSSHPIFFWTNSSPTATARRPKKTSIESILREEQCLGYGTGVTCDPTYRRLATLPP